MPVTTAKKTTGPKLLPCQRLWTKRLAAHKMGEPIEKAKINALNRRCGTQWRPTAETELLTAWFNKHFGYGSFKLTITGEQTTQGINWLKRRDVLKKLAPFCQQVVADFTKFTFQGIWTVSVNNHGMRRGVPVYRVYGKKGKWFDYYATAWQFGGLFVVLATSED
jgi:hypothetical protein